MKNPNLKYVPPCLKKKDNYCNIHQDKKICNF